MPSQSEPSVVDERSRADHILNDVVCGGSVVGVLGPDGSEGAASEEDACGQVDIIDVGGG